MCRNFGGGGALQGHLLPGSASLLCLAKWGKMLHLWVSPWLELQLQLPLPSLYHRNVHHDNTWHEKDNHIITTITVLNHRPGPPSMSCIWERWGSDSSANHWNMYMYMQKSHQNESDWSHHWSCLCQLYMLSAGSTPPRSQWQLWWPCKRWYWEGVPRPPDQTAHAWRQLHAGSGQWA